ncbi:MAG: hypothetical protein IJP05_08040, partial [Oscillospiraceae bacterium]|nr:hypothetical protein [Oscillospiraceae bacterium]
RSGNEATLAFYFYKTPISGVCHDEREQRRGRKAFLWQHKRRSAPSGRCSEAFTGAAVGLTQGDMPPRQDANGKSSTAVSLRQSKKWGYIIKTISRSRPFSDGRANPFRQGSLRSAFLKIPFPFWEGCFKKRRSFYDTAKSFQMA